MKKTISLLMLSTILTSVSSAQTLKCYDKKNKKDAGQIELLEKEIQTASGSARVIYQTSSSNDGWLLGITEDSTLYNVDPMVAQGVNKIVGELELDGYKLILKLNGQTLECQ